MRITALELVDFRNYRSLHVDTAPGLTVFVGPNATGKTNALEALQLLTSTESFRKPRWQDVVRWGRAVGRASLHAVSDDGVPHEVSLEVTAEGKRTYRVNGLVKRRVSDLIGIIPSVLFTPDDLSLVKGSSEKRRDEVDDLGSQLSKTFGAIRKDYSRVLRQRNRLLREDGTDEAMLQSWDEQLVDLGARLVVHRRRLVERVAKHAAIGYERLSGGERLTVRYVARHREDGELDVDAEREAMRAALLGRRADERARGTTLVGPHRDDVEFRIEDRDARTFASQGQQRSVALAWKLAEVNVVEEVLKRRPVLLLDDVMSELDERRRAALTEVVQQDVQTFMTTTDLGGFDPRLLEEAAIVEITG